VPGKEHLALHLQKALYGMKQGKHQWHMTLLNFMLHKLEWDACGYDQATCTRKWDDRMWAIIRFWVDDATVVSSEEHVHELEKAFKEHFGILGSSNAHWILGTSIWYDTEFSYVYISQEDYIHNIARKFNLQNTAPVYSPLPLGIDFRAIAKLETDSERSKAAKLPYKEIIGSLMFATIVSYPNC
jgi:hypothetical protein